MACATEAAAAAAAGLAQNESYESSVCKTVQKAVLCAVLSFQSRHSLSSELRDSPAAYHSICIAIVLNTCVCCCCACGSRQQVWLDWETRNSLAEYCSYCTASKPTKHMSWLLLCLWLQAASLA
jgi:hypothetical protein